MRGVGANSVQANLRRALTDGKSQCVLIEIRAS